MTVDLLEQIDAKNWEIDLSETSISDLEAGMSKDVDITVKTNDDTEAGIEELTLFCGETSIVLEVSVQNTKPRRTVWYSFAELLIRLLAYNFRVAIVARELEIRTQRLLWRRVSC